MPVVNTLGANITKQNAAPIQQVEVTLHGARLRQILDTVEVAASDDDTSTFRVARVHSSWSVSQINVGNDAITGGTSYDIGLYQTAENGGAVVDADAYASAVDLSSANTTMRNLAFEARNIDKIQNRVWQDAGLTADPNRWYDIVLTANTVGSGAGTISVQTVVAVD